MAQAARGEEKFNSGKNNIPKYDSMKLKYNA